MITGQVFVRETSKVVDGKRVVILLAVVGVDDDFLPEGESMYVVTGSADGLVLSIHPESGRPQPQFEGMDVDRVILNGRWRV